jgi:hypothetical protein
MRLAGKTSCMPRRSPRLALCFLAFLLAGLTLAPRLALAQDKKAIKTAEENNAKAMELFDNLEFEKAKQQLNKNLLFIKNNHLGAQPVAAKTHGYLGVVWESLGDPDAATLEFGQALGIDPHWNLSRAYRSPSLEKLVAAARAGTAQPAPEGEILSHNAIEEAPLGKSLRVVADTTGDQVKGVTLYYRAEGKERFTAVPMTGSEQHWEAPIPATAATGSSLHYYLEARGEGDKVLAASGSADSPHVVSITGGDDENPIDEPPATPASDKRHFYVSLGFGTAAAIPSGNAEVSRQKITYDKGYFLNEPFHLAPELGYFFSPHASMAFIFRLGFPLGANTNPHATQAPSFWARFNYHFGNYDGLTLHGDVGVGVMRHVVTLGNSPTPDPELDGKKDVAVGGPAWLGGGAGYVATLGRHLAGFVDLSMQTVIPVTDEIFGARTNYVFNFDFTVGLRLAF